MADWYDSSSKDSNKNGIVGGTLYNAPDVELKQKYDDPQKLDSLQENPKDLKAIDFKQDYTVLIRKKKYYAISQESDDLYIKIYQVNNFISLSTSHNVFGRPGQCRLVIKGGERVIAADKKKMEETNSGSFDDIKNSWNNIDNAGSTDGQNWTKVNGVDYKDLMKAREHKYYWKYAEKADWEPMDEVYIYSKSKVLKQSSNDDSQYKFVQIFFGYISSVSLSYSPAGGTLINIGADDHLKLLMHSRMANRPPLDMRVGGVGMRYDSKGGLIIEDDPVELTSPVGNIFAGNYPHEIIKACAVGAGIPQKYLTKRIEPLMRVPFLPQFQGTFPAEMYRGEWMTRLQYCQKASEILKTEFFADEEGNIVFKIPSYTIGINRLPANFEGIERRLSDQGTLIVSNGDGETTGTGNSLAEKYDALIRVIRPEEIMAFTITDSDAKVYTACQVTAEIELKDAAMKQFPPAVTRAVANPELIRRFGYRFIPITSTPVVGGARGAEIYANLIILESLSNRITGTITMIEEPTIRVGDPIRFRSFDEYPYKETTSGKKVRAQTVFYVEAIERSIKPGDVSTMNITLRAGRTYAQPSLFDQAQELYRDFYEVNPGDTQVFSDTVSNAKSIAEETTQTPEEKIEEQQQQIDDMNKEIKDTSTTNYTVQYGDSLWKIAQDIYSDGSLYKKIFEANSIDNGGELVSENRIQPGQVLKIPPN